MGKFFRRRHVYRAWRAPARRPGSGKGIFLAAVGRRTLAAFFVPLIIFATAQLSVYAWLNHRSEQKALQSMQLIPDTNGQAGSLTLNPNYKDPQVKPTELPQQKSEAAPKKPDEPGQVTKAAQQTALLKDPVQEYLDGKTHNGGQPEVLTDQEQVEKRTANSYTYRNADGGETTRLYTQPVNYKKDGVWKRIDGQIKDDQAYNKRAGTQTSALDRFMPDTVKPKRSFKQDDGLLKLNFKPLEKNSSNVSIGSDTSKSQLDIKPLNANSANPVMRHADDGTEFIEYKDAWQDTDLFYEQRGAALKEFISLKSANVPTEFKFVVEGATLRFGTDKAGKRDGTVIARQTDGTEVIMPALTASSMKNGPLSDPKLSYRLHGNTVSIVVDKSWLKNQPADSFPVIIDPTYVYHTYYHTGVPGGDLGHFIPYKSDGYVCNSTNCDMYVGSLNDRGLKSWRTMVHLPFTDVYGKTVSGASIYTARVNRPYTWSGFEGNRPYWATWAHCFGYNCRSGAPQASGHIDWDGYLDATGLMQWASQNNVGDGWLMMWGNEGDIQSFKAFSGANTYLDVQYYHVAQNRRTDIPTMNVPAQNASVVVSRPTLKMNPVGDPDGDLVRYSFHLMDARGNIVAYAGELENPSWTIPDGILADGEKYTWKGWVMERNAGNPSIVESGWRPTNETRTFAYDLRTGKDKSQAFDEAGPVSISLNTGNVYTGIPSHTIGALGGSIGVSLDYNTIGLARQGLTAKYYNNTTGTGNPAITVTDPNIDMNWGSSSPYPGVIQTDNFRVNWTGYFVAPQDGTYVFGATRDDNMTMSLVNSYSQPQFNFTCCGTNWSTTSATLVKGQAYPINVTLTEATGAAYAKLLVRTPDNVERIVPSEWLRAMPQTIPDAKGLTARFYKNTNPSGNPNFQINDSTALAFATTVSTVSTNWGTNTLVPGDHDGYFADNMVVNYSGYLKIPTTGNYEFGGTSDDGLRIRLGGQQAYSHTGGTGYSAPIYYEAGQMVPISVDYYEGVGSASVNLQWKMPNGAIGTIPGANFVRSASSVPPGWTLSVDVDGNIPYESLATKNDGSVELMDSTGFAHVYTWNSGAGAYKPPVNEDGYLTKNDDASYTFTDLDGRVYNFSPHGILTSISSPADDKNPAALKYEYTNVSTNPYSALPKLTKIVDGVDSSRYGQLYYKGDPASTGVCMSPPSGYVTPPAGTLCAFKTFPDNQITRFDYKVLASDYRLAQVTKPGDAKTQFTYNDSNGLLSTINDVRITDAAAAGVITTVNGTSGGRVQVAYDDLFRVRYVEEFQPYGNGGSSKMGSIPSVNNIGKTHTFKYGFQTTQRSMSHMFTPPPNGYVQYIEYDHLFRTTKACDIAALCTTTEWDPSKDLPLSSTDPQGLKSTTIYDEDDRAVEQYGAAPAAWFGSDRKPLPAYTNQIPRTQTAYDQGITGPAVAWYGARGQSLFGAPKLHTTGIDGTTAAHIGRNFQPSGSVPITTDTLTPGYGFSATGKITFPQAGIYTFKISHDDGARLYVNDNLVLDNWTPRTSGATQNSPEATFNAETGKSYRFKLDYIHFDDGTGPGAIDAWLRGPGITDISGTGLGTNQFGSLISPAYNLVTSTTAFDSQLGNTTASMTYSDPAYGLASGSVIDPAGLNLTNQATHEAPGAGYLRQTSKTMPGGNTAYFQYYGATEAVDNPCTPAADPASQAGQMKLRTEPDPDGAGPQSGRTTQTIYDSSGRQVASRINQEDWTCTEYDARSRVSKVTTPAVMNGPAVIRAGKTVITNYAYGGNPLITSIQDESGAFSLEEVDTFDRLARTVDTNGLATIYQFDPEGRLTAKNSPMGQEQVMYDEYNRPVSYALNSVVYATVSYDQYSRVQGIEYPEAKDSAGNKLKMEQVSRDQLQREIGTLFRFSDNTTYQETVNRSVAGMLLSSTANLRGVQATSSYAYDKAARLTQATIDNIAYTYDYSAPSAITCDQANANLNAHKNTNRTAFTAVNQATSQTVGSATYCYDNNDRLIASSDSQLGTPAYDEHGNTVSLSGGGTPITFTYNNTDQNTSITQGNNKVEYVRAPDDTILRKKEYANGVLTKSYRYVDAGRVLQSCSLTDDNSCATLDKYLSLPGGVLLTLSPANPDPARQTVYTIKNYRGDAALTVGANGLPTSSVYLYEPFGQASQSATFGTGSNPGNSSNESMGWAASPVRKQESLFSLAIVQMGARTYVPSMGRFLQVDPVEGGTPNAYTYAGDPVNGNDYSGQLFWFAAIAIIHVVVRVAPLVILAAKVLPPVVRAVVAVAKAVGPTIVSAGRAVVSAVTRSGGGGAASSTAAKTVSGVSSQGAKATSAAGRSSQGYTGPKINPAPNTLVRPGPFAVQSIPARSTSSVLNTAERSQLNRIGAQNGCHSCGSFNPGTKSGNWIADHQPVSSLNTSQAAQRLYPHCVTCSARQGAEARRMLGPGD